MSALIFFLVVVFLMHRSFVMFDRFKEKRLAARHAAERTANAREAVDRHISTLARKRRQLVIVDDYGRERQDKWRKELAEFIEIEGLLSGVPEGYEIGTSEAELSDQIDKSVQEYIDEQAASAGTKLSRFSVAMSPYDYEHLCAEILAESGWESRVTVATGDQGVDVTAERDGIRVAIQCKLYSSPVGNKAVQEVVAGAAYVGASHALVVSNAGYTKSAKELAGATGVRLLHHEDLSRLHEVVQS